MQSPSNLFELTVYSKLINILSLIRHNYFEIHNTSTVNPDVSFYKYVNQKRIAIAGDLLLNTNLNITEIALQSGFGSISAFIRMFKLINGCTPTEFRNMRDSGANPPRKEEKNPENKSIDV